MSKKSLSLNGYSSTIEPKRPTEITNSRNGLEQPQQRNTDQSRNQRE